MSYEFPPKRLHNTDAPDPAPLTKNLQPAARRLSELRAHNIDASDFKANGVIARSAYWKHYYGKATTGPGLNTNKIPTQGGSSSPDAKVDIPPDFSWHTVVATSAAVDCRAGDKLWINAGCVWSINGYTGASTHQPYPPCGFYKGLMHFALRVNGVIIEETITGKGNISEGPVQAWRQSDTQILTNNIFNNVLNKGGIGLPKFTIKVYHVTDTKTLNRPGPVKVCWALEVPDGSHTVELVARRISNQRHQDFVLHPAHPFTTESPGVDDKKVGWVSVYNRQISVLKLRQGGPSLGSDVVSIGAFDDGDVLSATELLTNRLEPLRVQANDLASGALRGPALIRSHLPTGIIATEQLLTTSFADSPFTNVWPGYATADFAPTPGWQTLTELIANNGGAGWNAAANECTIHLHANIEVALIEEGTGGYGDRNTNILDNRIWALLCLYERQGGTYTPIKVSEVFIPSCIADHHGSLGVPPLGLGYARTYGDLRRDAPLMAVLEHPTASGPTYTEFGVAVAIYSDPALSLTTRLFLSKGSLQVFQIRS